MLGTLFTLGATTLGVAIAGHGSCEPGLLLVSTLAVVPSILDMLIGQRLRNSLSEKAFRRTFLGAARRGHASNVKRFSLIWPSLSPHVVAAIGEGFKDAGSDRKKTRLDRCAKAIVVFFASSFRIFKNDVMLRHP
jgi:hypothetical protein